MTRKRLLWMAAILLVSLIAFFPLRLALDLAKVERIGMTARQVGGTVWSGRIGDLYLQSRPLGTFEVRAKPLSMLLLDPSFHFQRMDGLEGPFGGELVTGRTRGIRHASGRIDASGLFAPLPVESLIFEDATLLFRDRDCVEGSGRVTAIAFAPVPGLDLGSGLSGEIICEPGRAHLDLDNGRGVRLEYYVNASGDYRGWLYVTGAGPLIDTALEAAGFERGDKGAMLLPMEGAL